MTQSPRRHLIVAAIGAVAIALIAGACSSSSAKPNAKSTTPPSSTAARPASAAPYAKTGPYAVGFTQRKLAGQRKDFPFCRRARQNGCSFEHVDKLRLSFTRHMSNDEM